MHLAKVQISLHYQTCSGAAPYLSSPLRSVEIKLFSTRSAPRSSFFIQFAPAPPSPAVSDYTTVFHLHLKAKENERTVRARACVRACARVVLSRWQRGEHAVAGVSRVSADVYGFRAAVDLFQFGEL